MPTEKKSILQMNPGDFVQLLREQFSGGMPKKRTINLAEVGVRRVNWFLAGPSALLIVLAVVVFCDFAVLRRWHAVDVERWKLNGIFMELAQAYRTERTYDGVEERYAHYTFSGMTEEEMGRASRVDTMEMLWRVILQDDKYDMDSFSISGNTLTVSLTGRTLQEINLLVQALMKEELVDYCTVNTATMQNPNYQSVEDPAEIVQANIVIYLVSAPQEVSFS